MTKPMKYRDAERAMRAQGCVSKPGEVSPGVVGDAIKKMKCLPKGWLQ